MYAITDRFLPIPDTFVPSQSVTVVSRVPASQFASALEQIRSAGDRVVSEKVSGQDVSEEYLEDVEARLRDKRALEGQPLEIMKQAHNLVPITAFFGLPGWLLWRVLRRRISLRRPPQPSPIPTEKAQL